MKTRELIIEQCNALIPRDVIEERDGGQGRKLSYLAGFYVINRLNEVLGQGNWETDVELKLLHAGTIKDRYDKDVHSVHYMAVVRLTYHLPGATGESSRFGHTLVDVGYGDGTDKTNPGKAHELALKEAVTDGLKRCARMLGNSFGNGLYDRSGDGIEEETKPVASKVSSTPASSPVTPVGAVPAQPRPAVQPGAASGGPAPTRDAVLKSISQYSKVAIDKKVLTLEAAKDMLKGYGASTKEELNDQQAAELLGKLKEVLK